MFISQPLKGLPSQSAKPTLHATRTQFPPIHPVTALGKEQTWLHAPQLLESLVISTSQPSAGLALQSTKPKSQTAMVQTPCIQATAETCGPLVQTLLQVPQLLESVFRLGSQHMFHWYTFDQTCRHVHTCHSCWDQSVH